MTSFTSLASAGASYVSRQDYLSQSPSTVYVRPQRSIGDIAMDVTIEESHTDDMEITEHPVEQGASITDHAYLKPASVTIRAGVSDSGGTGTGDRRCVEYYQKLRELQGKREPFDLVTGKRTYKNMLIKSLNVVTEAETENVLMVTAELREVILVSVQTASVPRGRQKWGNKTGGVDQKGQKQAEPVQQSALQSGFGSAGSGYRRSK